MILLKAIGRVLYTIIIESVNKTHRRICEVVTEINSAVNARKGGSSPYWTRRNNEGDLSGPRR